MLYYIVDGNALLSIVSLLDLNTGLDAWAWFKWIAICSLDKIYINVADSVVFKCVFVKHFVLFEWN